MGNLSLAIENICSGEFGQNASVRGLAMIIENPYRILGLSSIANSVDAKNTAELISKVAAEGKSYKTPFDFNVLGKIDRSGRSCQGAVMKLKFKETDLKMLWFKSKKAVLNFGTPQGLETFFTPFFNTFTLNYDDFLASYVCLLFRDPDFTQVELYRHLFSVINNMLILTPEDFGAVFKNGSPVEIDVDDELLLISFASVILRPLYDVVSSLNLNSAKDIATLENLFGVLSKVNTPCMAFYRLNNFVYTLLSQWFVKQADELTYQVLTSTRDGKNADPQEKKAILQGYQQLTQEVLPTFIKIVEGLIPSANEINLQMRMMFYVKFKGFPALLEKCGAYDQALGFTEVLKDYAPSNDVYEQLEEDDTRIRAGMAAEKRAQEVMPEYVLSGSEEDVFWGEDPETFDSLRPLPWKPLAKETEVVEEAPPQEEPQGQENPFKEPHQNLQTEVPEAYKSPEALYKAAYAEYGEEALAKPVGYGIADPRKIKVKEIVSSRVVATGTPPQKGAGLMKLACSAVLIGTLCFGVWQISKVVNQPTIESLATQKIEILQTKDVVTQNTDKLQQLKSDIYYNRALYDATKDQVYGQKHNDLVTEYQKFYTVYEKSAKSYNKEVASYNQDIQ